MPKTIGYVRDNLGADAEELARKALEDIEWGKRFRNAKRETHWVRSERQYEGKHWGLANVTEDPDADLVVVNLSFSTVNTLVPFVTGNNPRFIVKPYSGDATVMGARAQEAYINRYWIRRESGAPRAVKTAATDSLVYGDGFGKVTYAIVQRQDAEIAEIYVDRIDPWHFWIDPMADGLHNARWCAERIRTTKEELADQGYRNLDLIEPGLPTLDEESGDRHLRSPMDSTSEPNWVEVYEYWDLVHKRLVVVAPGVDTPLKVVDDVRLPIVSLENHWIPKMPYHMGELEQIWSLQQELNKSRSQMLTHRRRNISKVFVKIDALSDQAEEALKSQRVGEIIPIRGDRPLNDLVMPMALTPLSADAYAVSEQISQDIFEVTGVNEYIRGAAPQIRRTATEASIIEGASNIKQEHKLAKIEQFTRDLAELVLEIAADVFPSTDFEEEQLYITGKDAEALNKIAMGDHLAELGAAGASPEILEMEAQGTELFGGHRLIMAENVWVGTYQVQVIENSTELRNPVFLEQKYREMAAQLTNAAPVLAQMGVQVNLRKVYELWFEAAGIKDVEEMFAPMPGGGIPQPPGPQGQPGSQAPNQLSGVPQVANAQPPAELLTALNTGALEPQV